MDRKGDVPSGHADTLRPKTAVVQYVESSAQYFGVSTGNESLGRSPMMSKVNVKSSLLSKLQRS